MKRDAAKQLMQKRILDTADQLFYAHGIQAIGVDRVAQDVGISKRTLYNHYPSKEALIHAYLSRRFFRVPPSERPAVDQVLGAFDWLERTLAQSTFRGCPFINAVAELGEPGSAVKEIAVAFKESRRTWFLGLLTRLNVPNPEELATQMVILVDGAIAQVLVRGDVTVAQASKQAARTLLLAAGIEVPPMQPITSPMPALRT